MCVASSFASPLAFLCCASPARPLAFRSLQLARAISLQAQSSKADSCNGSTSSWPDSAEATAMLHRLPPFQNFQAIALLETSGPGLLWMPGGGVAGPAVSGAHLLPSDRYGSIGSAAVFALVEDSGSLPDSGARQMAGGLADRLLAQPRITMHVPLIYAGDRAAGGLTDAGADAGVGVGAGVGTCCVDTLVREGGWVRKSGRLRHNTRQNLRHKEGSRLDATNK